MSIMTQPLSSFSTWNLTSSLSLSTLYTAARMIYVTAGWVMSLPAYVPHLCRVVSGPLGARWCRLITSELHPPPPVFSPLPQPDTPPYRSPNGCSRVPTSRPSTGAGLCLEYPLTPPPFWPTSIPWLKLNATASGMSSETFTDRARH